MKYSIILKNLLFQDLFFYLSLIISSYLVYLNIQDINNTIFITYNYIILNTKKLKLKFFY